MVDDAHVSRGESSKYVELKQIGAVAFGRPLFYLNCTRQSLINFVTFSYIDHFHHTHIWIVPKSWFVRRCSSTDWVTMAWAWPRWVGPTCVDIDTFSDLQLQRFRSSAFNQPLCPDAVSTGGKIKLWRSEDCEDMQSYGGCIWRPAKDWNLNKIITMEWPHLDAFYPCAHSCSRFWIFWKSAEDWIRSHFTLF